MDAIANELSKGIMELYGFRRCPKLLDKIDLEYLNDVTCKQKNTTRKLEASQHFITKVLDYMLDNSYGSTDYPGLIMFSSSYAVMEKTLRMSRAQIWRVIKDCVFMGMLEEIDKGVMKSSTYSITFATWDRLKAVSIVSKNVIQNTKINEPEVGRTNVSQSNDSVSQSNDNVSQSNDNVSQSNAIKNELRITNNYLKNTKNISCIFNFFESSKSQAKVYIETLVNNTLGKINLEDKNAATPPTLLPFSGISRDVSIFEFRVDGWFEIDKYDGKLVQQPYQAALKVFEHEKDPANSKNKWLNNRTPSQKLTGLYADMSLIANGVFERFPPEACSRLMCQIDSFTNKEARLSDACDAIVYYACASSFFGLNMDIDVLIDNIVEIHKGLKERGYDTNLPKAVEYLANPVAL